MIDETRRAPAAMPVDNQAAEAEWISPNRSTWRGKVALLLKPLLSKIFRHSYIASSHGLKIGHVVEFKLANGDLKYYRVVQELTYEECRKHWSDAPPGAGGYYKIRALKFLFIRIRT
jgi:hypothetical protein